MINLDKLEKYKFPVKRIPMVGCVDTDAIRDSSQPQIRLIKTDIIGIFKGEKLLGHHTNDYTITTNEKILDAGLEIVQDMGLDIEKMDEKLSWCNDKRMYVSLITDKQFSPNGGDPHNLMLTMYNSYDGSMSWGCELGLWRQICSNGAFVVKLMKKYRKKHFVEFKPEILREQIASALTRFPEMKFLLVRLKDTEFTEKQIDKIFEDAHSRALATKDEVDNISQMIKIDPNAYAVMNAFTYYFTHMAKSYERAKRFNAFAMERIAKLAEG